MIEQSGCKVGPRKGTYSEITGHENCGDCPGNYYNGGQCNYGGYHVFESEFNKKKNSLLNDFHKVKDNCCDPKKFLFATCIGVEKQSSLFQEDQVQEFQTKLRQIEDLRKENDNLLQEYKDPNTSPERKAQISEIIDQNEEQMTNLDQELDSHDAR
ncbi:13962_t:CDS:2 [Ambispora leptoticha]|uniref:13962_t:CDS:1 n=1 Tax=Ambispora leptoticha TaxID=144679 RepID=A0A9N9A8N9_9GLOM|nr:13962_t:CDS:2 [Ambispora leptoticha]